MKRKRWTAKERALHEAKATYIGTLAEIEKAIASRTRELERLFWMHEQIRKHYIEKIASLVEPHDAQP